MSAAQSPVPAYRIWLLLAGFVVWSAAFVAIYGMHHVGCVFGWNGDGGWLTPLRLVLLALLVAGVAGCALTVWWAWREQDWRRRTDPPPQLFLARAGLWANVAALAATLLTFLPAAALTLCL